jgi:hypothetical protein
MGRAVTLLGETMNTKIPAPDPAELIATAESILKEIRSYSPVAILGNLVDPKKQEYLGRDYFFDVPKNTYAHKSKTPNDFSGIYVFYENETAEYVGISNTIIRRLKQHLYGKKHNEASFAYLMARQEHEESTGNGHHGLRNDFPFDGYRKNIQKHMIEKWGFTTHPLSGGYSLSFSEIYISAVLKTKWNSFDPH